ncbi:MAG: metal ABC transporter permease [Thioalkalivibrio sp.]
MTLPWDPLFREAFLSGLVLAPLAALLGCWLRLRGEWLATLGYAHLAGAGGVLAAVLHWPMLLSAILASALGAVFKGWFGAARTGNEVYGLMILLGWCLGLLAAANHPGAALVGRVFLDGQILYAGRSHLITALALAVIGAVLLPRLSRWLLREHFQPGHRRANRQALWPMGLGFDGLVVLVVAATALAMGVMASFALVLLPAWVAWGLARGWRMVLWLSALLAASAYILAFWVALALDQPFGPVLVAVLLCLTPLRLLGRGWSVAGGHAGDL